ncbi:MAG TPA: APH(3') family aminoglycoside O-phosphotransferase [Rhizomicrobium sp.]|nr:APH(3') family aminoglycoside O-phosphotransferase [Rhizomicrobium sp.]
MTHYAVTDPAIDIPEAWRAELADYSWAVASVGLSSATVLRLEAKGHPTLFAKTESIERFAELPCECARTRWLDSMQIGCPKILKEAKHADRYWALMSAVPGRDLAVSPELAPERIITVAAEALRSLHEVAVASCPFDHRLEHRIVHARARMEAGLVNEADFDDVRQGRPAAALFEELVQGRPKDEDLVVAHGDASLANIITTEGGFSGFVDCARLGVADRHQDLALAANDIAERFGEFWARNFLRCYGAPLDQKRLDFYLLLDEFF